MFYKPLPVDARVTLEQQSQILGSTTKNSSKSEDFLIEYLEPRTSANIDDLSALFKKVPIQNIFYLFSSTKIFLVTLELTLEKC